MMKILPNTYEGLIWGMKNFDGIETDLRLTLDDGIVIFHDCYLQTGEKIEELTEKELADKGIPTLSKFLNLEEVVKLSKDKIMFLELKPNCRGKKRITREISEKFYEKVNQIILESNISKNNIKILSFSKQMLRPFMDEYKCYPILPDVNECNNSFVTLKAVPQFLGKSIKNEIVNGKKIGIVPSSMYLVLQRRLNLKMQKKVLKNDDSRNLLSSIDSVMKWILVSCFGYLGFKNARWGSLESHQSVTALARRYLMIAKEICEHEGFSVIAGITDSLFIRSNNNINDNLSSVNSLMYKITMRIGIPVDLEGKFNWLVFGSIRNNSQISALNRYFGLFSHDEFKLRGIRMRQRRATNLEIEFQDRVLNHFKNAITKIDFLEKIPSSYFILQNYIEKLYRKDIIATDLIIKLKSGRGSSGYISNNTIQSLTVQRYSNLGYDIYPGMSFHFVVVDNTLKNTEKIRIGPEISDNTKYDSNYYIELLNKCYLEITEDSQLLLFGRIKYSSDGIINSLDDYVTNL
jgi:DNA polymerase elongation subunit (family B)